MQLKNTYRLRFSLTTAISLAVVIVIGFMLLALLGKRYNGSLQVNAVPNDSTVTIKGHTLKSNELISLRAGTYTVSVSRHGFATTTETTTIKSRKTQTIQVFLSANSNEGQDWLRTHPDQVALIEGRGSTVYDQLSATNTAKYPIIKQLPLYDPRFRIDYGSSEEHPNDSNAIALYINALDPSGRQAALQLIRSLGYDPSDMEIVFTTPQE